ncbi:MAG TPA: biopolymer transporter ExbB, partial [Rhodobacter sp.]|nr:biopolymer transporter ExbB [Rhodobacter sp.]HCK06716.1 biopolymer transporter ExbB [Rhodobacter sp.]
TMQEGGQSDAESRMRLRSIDVQLLRILEELAAGREETVVAMRADIAKLTETVAALNPDSSKKG